MIKSNTVFVPKYLNDFNCIGSKCEDNCCYGWKVQINEDMYKKYKKVPNNQIKPVLEKFITRNRSNPTAENYAKIRMDSNGNCPFLNEDKLCNIHLTLGSEYLSKVCTTYPRVTNIVNGIYEKSLSLSCPEITRMVILNPNIMEFEEIKEPTATPNIINMNINTDDNKYSNKVHKYFWDLRIFAITLLQNRNYKVWERLIILGFFIRKVDRYAEEGSTNLIPTLVNDYNNLIDDGIFNQELENIPTRVEIQMEFMKKLNDLRLLSGMPQNTNSYVTCVIEFLKGLDYTDEADIDEVTSRYNNAYRDYYKPFMDEHEYMLENILVNTTFMNMFPVNSSKGVFEGYMVLVATFALIKMMLIGISAYHKGLNEDIIIKLIYSFSRTIEHSGFLNSIINTINENEYNSLAHMAVLIKN